MAAGRRIMIAVVGLLLILDAGALAFIKLTSGPSPSEEKSKLVIWIDDGAKAKGVAAMLKEQGYQPVVKPDKRKSEVEADFRLAMSSSKKELLEPIAAVLRQGGHSGLSYSEDGTKLYYGGFFKQKAQASRVGQRIKEKDQIVFEVVPGKKTVSKPSHKVILLSVPSNMVADIITEVEAKATIADHEEISLEPKPEEAEAGAEE